MLRALSDGLATLRLHRKAILLPYLVNLLVGLSLAIPFALQFEAALDDSAHEELLVEGMDFVWMQWFREQDVGVISTFGPGLLGMAPFLRHLELILIGGLSSLPAAILVMGALYLLLQSLMTAAILGSFANDPSGTTIREFFRNGAEFFGRILRVRLLALSVLGAAFWFFGLPLIELATRFVLAAQTDRHAFVLALGLQAIFLLLILVLKMVSDYAKIAVASEDRTSAFLGYVSALTFCISNFLPAIGLYLILVLSGAVWVLVYAGLNSLIPQSSGVGILAAVLLQQLYLLGRLGVRACFLSSQTHFFLKREGLFRQEF